MYNILIVDNVTGNRINIQKVSTTEVLDFISRICLPLNKGLTICLSYDRKVDLFDDETEPHG